MKCHIPVLDALTAPRLRNKPYLLQTVNGRLSKLVVCEMGDLEAQGSSLCVKAVVFFDLQTERVIGPKNRLNEFVQTAIKNGLDISTRQSA